MTGLKIIGRIGEQRLADYAKMPLPALFNETTAAEIASKRLLSKTKDVFNPLNMVHRNAAMAKNKDLALNTLA